MIKVGAAILCRFDSSRYPGKALIKLYNSTEIIKWIYLQLSATKVFDDVVICTSYENSDNVICDFCRKNNLNYFRGPKNDVLKRIIDLSSLKGWDYICRFNGDSPFIANELVLNNINIVRKNYFDVISNTIIRTYPYGITFQCFKGNFLKKHYSKKLNRNILEHVTPIQDFCRNEKAYIIRRDGPTLSRVKMVLDTKKDLLKLRKLKVKNVEDSMKNWSKYANLICNSI